MRTTKALSLLLIVFALALGAGVSGGMLMARLPAKAATPTLPTGGASPLADELSLTADQRDKMREIWEEVRDVGRECVRDGQLMQKDRDDALIALLNDEQKAKYEKIAADYARQFATVAKRRTNAFRDGVKRTQTMLNDEQRRRYERILRDRVGSSALDEAMSDEPPQTSGN